MAVGGPHIEDIGHDGVDIRHLIDLSDAGSWEAILPFCVNIRILNDLPSGAPRRDRLNVGPSHTPDAPFERPFDADQSRPDALSVDVPFHHENGDTDV